MHAAAIITMSSEINYSKIAENTARGGIALMLNKTVHTIVNVLKRCTN